MTTVPTVDVPAWSADADEVSTEQVRPRRSREPWFSRIGPRSLIYRLVSGVVVLVTMLVLVIGASTFFLLKQFLYTQLDNQVRAVAGSNITGIGRCVEQFQSGLITANDPRCTLLGSTSSIRSVQREWIRVTTTSGGTFPIQIGDSASYALMKISDGEAGKLLDTGSDPVTVRTSDGVTLRALGAVTADGSLGVVVGLSTSEIDEALGRLLTVELSIGAGAIAVALLASYFGVTFGLKPLRRVTSTAQEVTAELSATGRGLERRVPIEPTTDTEVGQLATSVNTLLGAVETQFAARVRSEDRMREFLADASHELRTPLTSIRGFAELSRMQRRQAAAQAGLDPATAAEDDALDRIESEGTRMSKLVDDLLLLARSDHGSTPARDRVEVHDMVVDVVESARVAYPDRPIDAAVPPGLAVLGDRDQLLRVVRNLVTNAAVHTAPGGPILVTARGDGEEVVIQVADSGPGLEPDQAAHVFDRFWRADKARTRARGGSGLGMSIVATIIEQHQGVVRFDSSPETGSTVTIVLPATPPTT